MKVYNNMQNKNNNSTHKFDNPEIEIIFFELLGKLFEESGRGAILICSTIVEEFLTSLIEDRFPEKTKQYKNKLLKYPGSLSSFSAKIELSYAFGLIDLNLYESLQALRRIRNEAAHISSNFSLLQQGQQLISVYSLGPEIPEYIRQNAIRLMIMCKLESIEPLYKDFNIPKEDRNREVNLLFEDPEIQQSFFNQIPHWELLLGVCMICDLIDHHRKKSAADKKTKL